MQGNFFLLIPVLLPVIAGVCSMRIIERSTRNIMNMAVLLVTAALSILIAAVPALGGDMTVLRLTSMVGMANVSFTKEELLKINAQLNKIRKPKK